MQLEQIRAKVNACYGFNAVSRISLTQTAPTGFAEGAGFSGQLAQGFAEGQTPFAARKTAEPDPHRLAQADRIAESFPDPQLSAAMRQMALNILSRRDTNDRKAHS